ncbi:DUF402 domain-containing protein [Hamadaea tsunoensis]|uniref:DUF402 domain-containing protein n=1 Tax=Hamadaea tsunoensis TaxID=53368 RepID=UPI000557DDE2|nr:DUF402 domain-containing protein [Hamadaea tsunoensis]
MSVTVRLTKNGREKLSYPAELVADDGTHLVVRAPWAGTQTRDMGFVRFEAGDVFTEHYWRDRWFAIKEVRTAAGLLKGWYCDVCRPVTVEDGVIEADDLDLDLWLSGDRQSVLRLDQDEFDASGLAERDPYAAVQARRALDELAHRAETMFDGLLEY